MERRWRGEGRGGEGRGEGSGGRGFGRVKTGPQAHHCSTTAVAGNVILSSGFCWLV